MLLEAVRTRNEELAQTWKRSEQWATIEQLCSEYPHPVPWYPVAAAGEQSTLHSSPLPVMPWILYPSCILAAAVGNETRDSTSLPGTWQFPVM